MQQLSEYQKKFNKDFVLENNIINIRQMIDNNTKIYSNSIAIRYILSNGKIENKTYANLKNDILRLSPFFNMYHKEHIALLMPRGYESIVSCLSIIYTGNVVVLLNLDDPIQEIKEKFIKADVTKVIIDKNIYNNYNSLKDDFTCISFDYNGFNNILDNDNVNIEIDLDDCAMLLFTSGTSGKIKVVPLSHRNIMSGAQLCGRIFFPMLKNIMIVLPFWHSYVCGCIFGSIYSGKCLDIGSSILKILDELFIFNSDGIMLVPAIIRSLYKVFKYDYEHHIKIPLKHITSGGSSIDENLINEYYDLGITIYNGYGATETAGGFVVNIYPNYKKSSVGIVPSLNTVKIVDGEVWIKGESVVKCYYNDDEMTKQCFDEGWYKTGDVGYIDEDGMLYIQGRINDLIVLFNGEKIMPDEIEQKISEKINSNDVLVYNKVLNGKDCLTALVYIDYETFDGVMKMIKNINKEMPSYKRIRSIEFSKNRLERTHTGKIKRKQQSEVLKSVKF